MSNGNYRNRKMAFSVIVILLKHRLLDGAQTNDYLTNWVIVFLLKQQNAGLRCSPAVSVVNATRWKVTLMLVLTCEPKDCHDLQPSRDIFTRHFSPTDCNLCLSPFTTHRCSLNHRPGPHRLSEKTSLSIFLPTHRLKLPLLSALETKTDL